MTCAVIIPIYKYDFSKNEIISLKQVVRILGKHPIFFVAPEKIKDEKSEYNWGIHTIYFDNQYFDSVDSYSKFMLQPNLYVEMNELGYDYILIYQLDAFVFSDRLKEVCSWGYDYIGAPTLEGMFKPYNEEIVLYTQNGGLSLRNTGSFINWIVTNKKEIDVMTRFDLEDSIIYALRNKGLKYAPIDKAMEFSVDSNVRTCLDRLHGILPMGCHAWERYAYEIWKPIIESYGYETEIPFESRRIVKNYYELTLYNNRWTRGYTPKVFYDAVSKFIEEFDGKVYVYGMGKLGYQLMQFLHASKIEIIAFIDNNPDAIKRGMYPEKVILGSEFCKIQDGIPVIVSMYHHVDACIQLEKIGYHHRKRYATYSEIYCEFEKNVMDQSI